MLGTPKNDYFYTLHKMFSALVKHARAQNEPLRSQLLDQFADFHDAYLPAIIRYRDYGHRSGPKSFPGRVQADTTFAFLDITVGGKTIRQHIIDRLAEGVPDEGST